MSVSTEPSGNPQTPDDRTRAFFHGYAGEFNALYGNINTPLNALINRLFRRSMYLRFARTMAGCEPIAGASVLDVGCGPGHYAIELARRGAGRVVGVDFADGMIELARRQAAAAGVADGCEFSVGDFNQFGAGETFDYALMMGFMDYVAEPAPLIRKLVALTRRRAFLSFPAAGGFFAWQRQVRYRKRCPLYLYRRNDLESLFAGIPEVSATIEPISRDFFVTMTPRSG
jgi:SAM-dependent methyltransferase